MPRSAVVALLALLASGALAAPAQAVEVDVPEALGEVLERVDRATPLPVLVPETIDLDVADRVFGSGVGGRRSYSLALDGAPDCRGNACALASFDAERGGTLAFRRRVRLTRTVTGSYKPLSCGASCSPPTIDFVRRGVRYAIQARVGAEGDAAQRAALVAAARSALRAGPR
jgi:hypothetical protein